MPSILGLHHVTAIAGDPQGNVDFYTGVLGLRLVSMSRIRGALSDLRRLEKAASRRERILWRILWLDNGSSWAHCCGQLWGEILHSPSIFPSPALWLSKPVLLSYSRDSCKAS